MCPPSCIYLVNQITSVMFSSTKSTHTMAMITYLLLTIFERFVTDMTLAGIVKPLLVYAGEKHFLGLLDIPFEGIASIRVVSVRERLHPHAS